jgi:hypothetical protein
MSRMPDLLRKAADALNDGRDPLTLPFLSDNDVTCDECFDMAELMAAGAQAVAWAMDNPKIAAAAFRGAKMETLLRLMERAARADR